MDHILKFLNSIPQNLSAFIFLGGIHGVGKTTLCNIAFIPAGYHCITASSLIAADGSEVHKNKLVDCVADNQIALLNQLNFEKKAHHRLVLDGHFCLVNSQNQVEPIDSDYFRAMNPSHLIIFKGNPERIIKRLNARDGKRWDLSFITRFQIIEERHAKYVSDELNIPLHVFELSRCCGRQGVGEQRIEGKENN